MLNYTKRNVNFIALIMTSFLCLILFIILDIFTYKNAENNLISNKVIYKSSINFKDFNYMKRQGINIIKIEDAFQQVMQIADIYDENTKIDEIENKENEEKNPRTEIQQLKTSYSNSTEDINQILDKNNNWRIKIPKINVNAPINNGTSQDVLAVSVGHFPESTKWNGNVALAGHNRGYRCNFFQNIKKLEVGDKIIYSQNGNERTYKVIINKIITQTDWSYIKNTNDNRITLITCVENMHDYRRCVQAVEV